APVLDHPDHEPRSGRPLPASGQLRLRMERAQYLVLRTDGFGAQLDASDDAVGAIGSALENRRFAAQLAHQVSPETLAKAFSAAAEVERVG
ncbi:hypothetical protein ACIQ6V_33515, partial [Streptomyces sp. NPDC096198]|uniref:hypothetical protein n=1 Tax=Streptomyces sp. NPDC096198 TaxID=3366080 RepID=UPI00381D52E2